MSMVMEQYEDPIILLANDPDLNKEIGKTNQLINLISEFSIAERKVSKLCQLSLTILQTLEKIELNLKNWAFISLDINSGDHFSNSNDSIKQFNHNISLKVLGDCSELNKKLSRISVDLDYITKASRTLSPLEYISDSGTLLTSLTLRNIKLKYELTDKVTVAYSRAKLITIGSELEEMIDSGDATVGTYKSFVASLLKQLTTAIEDEDMTEKHECLAVINDMEKMFEAFKLEKAQERTEEAEERAQTEKDSYLLPPTFDVKSPKSDIHSPTFPHGFAHSDDDSDSIYGSEMGSSMYGSVNPPMIRSITKSTPTVSSSLKNSKLSEHHEHESFMGSSILHKTTLSEEMPYLMSAFDSARNVQQDINNFKSDEEKAEPVTKSNTNTTANTTTKSDEMGNVHYPDHHPNLPQTPLNAQSSILHEPKTPSPYSFLYSNNSLLSRLGIKPQVITTPTTTTATTTVTETHKNDQTPDQRHKNDQRAKTLGLNTTSNIRQIENTYLPQKQEDKENMIKPLTQKNLASLTFSSLSITNDFHDHVE